MKITPTRARWLSLLGAWVLRALGATWRVRRQGFVPADWKGIVAFLHGDILLTAHAFRRFGAAVLISQHGDGELIARIIERMGNHAVRGSSTRGGARAVRELLRGWPAPVWGITPDGPKGPRGTVQEGVIVLAALSGRPIYPVGYAFSRGRRLRSWDRFAIPGAFARIVVHVGEPLLVPRTHTADDRAALAKDLEQRLQAAGEAASAGLRSPVPTVVWPRPTVAS